MAHCIKEAGRLCRVVNAAVARIRVVERSVDEAGLQRRVEDARATTTGMGTTETHLHEAFDVIDAGERHVRVPHVDEVRGALEVLRCWCQPR